MKECDSVDMMTPASGEAHTEYSVVGSRYFLPPWIASRTFLPPSAEAVSVISNELDHELIRLDDAPARLWGTIADSPDGADVRQLCEVTRAIPEQEVQRFLDELVGLNLLSHQRYAVPIRLQVDTGQPAAPSGRYQSGGYEEPVAGGDNLVEEFELQDWALSKGYLWSAAWEMTYRCNESCVHCFNPGASHAPGEKSYRKTREVSFAEAKTLLAEMRGLGVFRLLLTGGEVILRKDFFEVLAEARRLGFSVTVFTNGTLLDEDRIDRLAALYPHRVELTLYSEREKHDQITRLKGSFDKTVAAARALVARGVTVAIKTTVMRDTAFDHRALRVLCEQIGCEYLPDFNMSAGVDGARSPLNRLLLDADDLIRNALDPMTPLWVGTPDSPNRIDLQAAQGKPVCGAGRSTMSISAEGNVGPCNSLPIYMGSVRGEGLAHVWGRGRLARLGRGEDAPGQDALSQWQSVVRGTYHVCGKFERCVWCQKCPGMAFLESGDERAPSVSNCRTAAARRIAFDLITEWGDAASGHIDPVRLQQRYSDETTLWSTSPTDHAISLQSVKDILRSRSRTTVLTIAPNPAAGPLPAQLTKEQDKC